MKKLILLPALFLLVPSAQLLAAEADAPLTRIEQPATSEAEIAAARKVASQWLQELDAAHYDPAWQAASEGMQQRVSQTLWTARVQLTRKPLGALVSREPEASKTATELPGLAAGNYVVIEFDSRFAEERAAVETVTLVQDDKGDWKVAGYFIG